MCLVNYPTKTNFNEKHKEQERLGETDNEKQ